MKTISLIALFFVFAFNTSANIVVKTSIKNHTSNSKCFMIHVLVMDVATDGTPWYVSSGDVMVNDCGSKMRNSQKSLCRKKKMKGQQLITDEGAPSCLKEALANPIVYADFEMQKAKILERVKMFTK